MKIEFEYDKLGRIKSERISSYDKGEDAISLRAYIHTYKKGYHKVEFNGDSVEEDTDYAIEEWFNHKGDVLESKC